VVLRRGENVVVPIPGRGGSFGVLACDAGLTGRRVDTEVLMRAAVTTRVLAPLLAAMPTYDQDPQESSQAPGQAAEEPQALAARAARALTEDPEIDRVVLAQQLATTADHLGRVFKAAFGESLGDYRNRVRTRRFLALVDAGGGNLLEAALSAGFGSYAQFHRVFRRILGESPAEYLRAGKCGGERVG
jgi:transcriptional regulator GlxA family with amidase domain